VAASPNHNPPAVVRTLLLLALAVLIGWACGQRRGHDFANSDARTSYRVQSQYYPDLFERLPVGVSRSAQVCSSWSRVRLRLTA
jgi:hypothetical protein